MLVINNKEIFREVYSYDRFSKSLQLGILLAIVGGILESYTFVGRGKVFANAQTCNVVLMGIAASKGDWRQTLLSFMPVLANIIGVITVETIKGHLKVFFTSNWLRLVLVLEAIVLFIVGFIPSTLPNQIATVIIAFVASLQINSFKKLVDSPYCTAITTANMRTITENAYLAIIEKDSTETVKTIRYMTIMFSFIVGGFIGGLLTLDIGIKAIWSAAFILICSLILLNTERVS
jgi:uncharacterized membrane protein YoaK (UPF0700 family)